MQFAQLRTLFFSSFVAVSALAGGGSGSGNGGISVVCRDRAGKIISARLLDLWEAENDPDLDMKFPTEEILTTDAWMARARKNLDEADPAKSGYDLQFFLPKILGSVVQIRGTDAGIVDPEDFHPRLRPKAGCSFEAAAKYLKSGKIQIDSEIFNRLSPMDRAALFIHEALYLSARKNRLARDSDATRLVVASIFEISPKNARIYEYSRDLLEFTLNEQTLFGRQPIVFRQSIPTVLNLSVNDRTNLNVYGLVHASLSRIADETTWISSTVFQNTYAFNVAAEKLSGHYRLNFSYVQSPLRLFNLTFEVKNPLTTTTFNYPMSGGASYSIDYEVR